MIPTPTILREHADFQAVAGVRRQFVVDKPPLAEAVPAAPNAFADTPATGILGAGRVVVLRPARNAEVAVQNDRGARGLLVRALDRLDRWVERHEGYRPIGEGGFILRLRIGAYRRPRVVLADGTAINPGDLVGELHLDNRLGAALAREGHGGIRFRRELRRMLPALALDLCTRPEYRDVRAVGAATLFGRHLLTSTLGFECRPLPPFTRWWLGTWERILLAAYHPEGYRRLVKGRREELQQVWISRRALEKVLAPVTSEQDAAGSRPRV